MGARSYLSQRYAYTERLGDAVPDYVFAAYDKLLRLGLFRSKRKRKGARDDTSAGLVLVTGGASGIGAAASRRLPARGCGRS